MRDLKGYANHYPDVRWPGDARVAVSVVLNIEEGAELLLSAGDERNEAIHEAIHQVEGASDLCLESHFRIWRARRLLAHLRARRPLWRAIDPECLCPRA